MACLRPSPRPVSPPVCPNYRSLTGCHQRRLMHPARRWRIGSLLPSQPDWAGGLRAEWTPGRGRRPGTAGRVSWPGRCRITPRHGIFPAWRVHPNSRRMCILAKSRRALCGTAPRLVARSGQGDIPERAALARVFAEFAVAASAHCAPRRIRPEFAAFPWAPDQTALRAWQRGQTGVPIVDAGMRELWQTGWMHNRVRMIAASYLVKHLLQPWQAGEAWFWDYALRGR